MYRLTSKGQGCVGDYCSSHAIRCDFRLKEDDSNKEIREKVVFK